MKNSKLIGSLLFTISAVLGFRLGHPKQIQNSDLKDLLKKELGSNFKEKNINDVYLAGPHKTISCGQ